MYCEIPSEELRICFNCCSFSTGDLQVNDVLIRNWGDFLYSNCPVCCCRYANNQSMWRISVYDYQCECPEDIGIGLFFAKFGFMFQSCAYMNFIGDNDTCTDVQKLCQWPKNNWLWIMHDTLQRQTCYRMQILSHYFWLSTQSRASSCGNCGKINIYLSSW